jgi:hypothetical protein
MSTLAKTALGVSVFSPFRPASVDHFSLVDSGKSRLFSFKFNPVSYVVFPLDLPSFSLSYRQAQISTGLSML